MTDQELLNTTIKDLIYICSDTVCERCPFKKFCHFMQLYTWEALTPDRVEEVAKW